MAIGDIPELKSQLLPSGEEAKEIEGDEKSTRFSGFGHFKWWAQIAMYSIFVLSSQAIGTILGRLYFNKGGNSKWMATLVQVVGFPILTPFLFISSNKPRTSTENVPNPSLRIIVLLYVSLGIAVVANCMMYTVGLQYLPVTTYSLICASQLGFSALFSFLLNGQKFTPYIVNSVVLLTLSSVLLVFVPDESEDGSVKPLRMEYIIGFLSTVAASAGYALSLSVTQLAFRRIFKRESFRLVVEMSFYQSLVATLAIVVGLFASGEWRTLGKEMDNFALGTTSYIMNLVWTAVSWQMYTVGCVGLIFKVSSLFSNVISILGLPITPVMAVFVFRDKMDSIKVVSMLLALWGFISYTYQHYLDDSKAKAEQQEQSNQASQVSWIQRV